jgi:GT2 family glycosyltransferase
MVLKMKISASLVLYCSRKSLFEAAIANFLGAVPDGVLYVVDNSPVALESDYFVHPRVVYVHNVANIGFGAAHNRAFSRACPHSDLHLILNPDIRFGPEVLDEMTTIFQQDAQLVAAMPKIVYPDGSLQRLCKLLPTPADLLVRRFLPLRKLRENLDYRYEMHELCQDKASEVPTLSGCFLVVRSRSLLEVGGFDERYFMYMEDVDLVRRLAMTGKSLYVPTSTVIHEYAKGSYRNYRLLRYHIQSAIKYFNKWGWFFDRHRGERNRFCSAHINRREAGIARPGDFGEVQSQMAMEQE